MDKAHSIHFIQGAQNFFRHASQKGEQRSRGAEATEAGNGSAPPGAMDAIAQMAQLYYASKVGQYSALVMMVKMGPNPSDPSIANVYGAFDAAVLGGSFNIPPEDPSTPTGEMDFSIMQMTAFKGDAAGAAFMQKPDGPPPCAHFNYSIMTMDVTNGTFPIKPKGWKAGDVIPLTLNVAEMAPLDISALGNLANWCKATPAPAAAPSPAPASAPAPATATAATAAPATEGRVQKKDAFQTVEIVAMVLIGLGVLFMFFFIRSLRAR